MEKPWGMTKNFDEILVVFLAQWKGGKNDTLVLTYDFCVSDLELGH